MNDKLVKRKKLSKNIKKTIVDLNIRSSDVGYLIKNLMFGYTKHDLISLVERDDIPIGVQLFAHALLKDFKAGSISQAASMMQWAFDNTKKSDQENIKQLTSEQIDDEIQKLLTKAQL